MVQLTFKLSEVEGPLDLILQLLQKHKLSIHEIEISALLEQYLAHIEQLRDQNMELASEFLEMAARLVHMKTVSLLPRHEEFEELRTELAGQLLEYEACKEAAAWLSWQNEWGDVFVREPMPLERDTVYRLQHTTRELLRHYRAAMGRGQRRLPPPASAFSGIVQRRVVSVNSRILYILRMMYRNRRLSFDALFSGSRDRSELVATFLALLELIKGKRITADSRSEKLTFHGRDGGQTVE